MKFEKLDITRHDIDKVSKLIYETELSVFKSLLGNDEDQALENIKNLIKMGNNSLGHENIHIASNEAGKVLGILVSFYSGETSLWTDFKAYFKIMDFYSFLNCAIKGTMINELLTARVGINDYYLSNIAVDPAFRGRGIGSFILTNAIKVAEDKGYTRVILDVTMDNEGAFRWYKKFGFNVYGKKEPKLIFKGEGTYNMEFILLKTIMK